MEVSGDYNGSKEVVWLFFSFSVRSESELSSINCRGRFDRDLGTSIVKFLLTH